MSICGATTRPALLVLFFCCSPLIAYVPPALTATSSPQTKRGTAAATSSTLATDTGDTTSQRRSSDDDVLFLIDHPEDSEKEVFKREDVNDSPPERGMWFGPRMGRQESALESTAQGMWFGPRMGRSNLYSKGRRSYEDDSEVSPTGGMWFGPRMGRSSDAFSEDKQQAAVGMWFGPRMGRSNLDIFGSKARHAYGDESEVSPSSGMWFGPRMGRSSDAFSEDKQQAAVGMWFGPRMGRSLQFDSYVEDQNPQKDGKFLLVFRRQLPMDGLGRGSLQIGKRIESQKVQDTRKKDTVGHESTLGGMWFGPRMGRKREVEWNEAGMKGSGRDAGMWFGPRLG